MEENWKRFSSMFINENYKKGNTIFRSEEVFSGSS